MPIEVAIRSGVDVNGRLTRIGSKIPIGNAVKGVTVKSLRETTVVHDHPS